MKAHYSLNTGDIKAKKRHCETKAELKGNRFRCCSCYYMSLALTTPLVVVPSLLLFLQFRTILLSIFHTRLPAHFLSSRLTHHRSTRSVIIIMLSSYLDNIFFVIVSLNLLIMSVSSSIKLTILSQLLLTKLVGWLIG